MHSAKELVIPTIQDGQLLTAPDVHMADAHVVGASENIETVENTEAERPYDGTMLARMLGVTAGVVALGLSSDPVSALAICLTFWMAGLLMRWPATVFGLGEVNSSHGKHAHTGYFSNFRTLWSLHLWSVVILVVLTILLQPALATSVQFWLLLAAVGYHILRVQSKSTLL